MAVYSKGAIKNDFIQGGNPLQHPGCVEQQLKGICFATDGEIGDRGVGDLVA